VPRYAVLEHDHPYLHWDFLLEQGEVLRAWRLEHPPEEGRLIAAKPLADHRKLYLTYEGPISGNRGSISRWDSGEFTLVEESPTRIRIRLAGTKLRGEGQLEKDADPGAGWRFIFREV